jgi:CBS domain-containing protein
MARKIQDVMTRNVEVMRPHDSIRAAAEKMRDLNVGPVPICDGQRVVGMLTDRDIVVRVIADGKNPDITRISDVMSAGVEYCFEDEDINDALEHMAAKQVRRLIVVNRDKKLVGIVSLGDLSQEAREAKTGEALEASPSPPRPCTEACPPRGGPGPATRARPARGSLHP